MSDHDQIADALRAHRSIKNPALKHSPILLKRPAAPIKHKLQTRPLTEKEIALAAEMCAEWEEILKKREDTGIKMLGEEVYRPDPWGFPILLHTEEEREFVLKAQEEWRQSPNHETLWQILKRGWCPDDFGDFSVPDVTELDTARKHAQRRGHRIPSSFFGGSPTSYGEEEAWFAAWMMVDGGYGGGYGLWYSGIGDWLERDRWRQRVMSLKNQFAVPNPRYPEGHPYLLDQLWVVIEPGPQVRLFAVEVDGEGHLTEEQQKKDRIRDAALESLGYEVYRVAGWWCRIDPYRVIAEVLEASGLFPNAHRYLSGGHLTTIDEYVCDICSQLIVRWDGDWLQAWRDRGTWHIAHESCSHLIEQEEEEDW